MFYCLAFVHSCSYYTATYSCLSQEGHREGVLTLHFSALKKKITNEEVFLKSFYVVLKRYVFEMSLLFLINLKNARKLLQNKKARVGILNCRNMMLTIRGNIKTQDIMILWLDPCLSFHRKPPNKEVTVNTECICILISRRV